MGPWPFFLSSSKMFSVGEVDDSDFHEFPLRYNFLLQAQSNEAKQSFSLNDRIISTICYMEERLANMEGVSKTRHGACSHGVCSQARVGNTG